MRCLPALHTVNCGHRQDPDTRLPRVPVAPSQPKRQEPTAAVIPAASTTLRRQLADRQDGGIGREDVAVGEPDPRWLAGVAGPGGDPLRP
jgi:hypothetical protein